MRSAKPGNHLKSGQTLETETLFFLSIFLQILCFKRLRLVGERTSVLSSTAIMEWDFWTGNVATIDVDNFYTLLKVSVSKGHPIQDVKC